MNEQINQLSNYKNKIIFAYYPQFDGNDLSIKQLQTYEIIASYKQIKNVKKTLSFTDYLILYYKIDIIIPIFHLISFSTKDGIISEDLLLLA